MAISGESYFSDSVRGTTPRVREELTEATRGALRALIDRRIQANWLAQEFPSMCPDGDGVVGTNVHGLGADIQGMISSATWPLWQEATTDEDLFDMLEYIGRRASLPKEAGYHQFFRHYELSFDSRAGRIAFARDVNELLARGGSVFEMTPDMHVRRKGAPETTQTLSLLRPDTGDSTLDALIETGRVHFASRIAAQRQTAIEKLWDAFERLKSIDAPGDKRQSVEALLGRVADQQFRQVVAQEMRDLTNLGNTFQIRHHEIGKPPIPVDSQDYVAGRMANLLVLLLRSSGRLAK